MLPQKCVTIDLFGKAVIGLVCAKDSFHTVPVLKKLSSFGTRSKILICQVIVTLNICFAKSDNQYEIWYKYEFETRFYQIQLLASHNTPWS